ncbi:MAG: AAA family ATPase [Byssovorax sp.]
MPPPSDPPEAPEPTDASDEIKAATRRFHLKLSSLYLDPNNYRFIDNKHYKRVDRDEESFRVDVQLRTRQLLLGEKQSNVEDLLASLHQNGWLDMEPIQVRQVGTRYLVVEGNRRVATLKYLLDRHQNGSPIGALDPAVFDKIPVVRVADTDPLHHLVIMGLHHISGKRQWPPINQAHLMRELRANYGKSPDEICQALAISKREFNLSIRTLALVNLYKQSDYGEQFSSDKFNLFREVLKAPALRNWIGWDDTSEDAKDKQQLQRLFSWVSRETATEAPDANDEEENRVSQPLDPVVTTGTQVRELAGIIADPETVRILDETRSLQSASLSSGVLARNDVDVALQRVEQATRQLFARATTLERGDLGRIEEAVNRLSGVLVAAGRHGGSSALSQTNWIPYQEFREANFSDVVVTSYRGLQDVHLSAPSRINLIAGVNNAGKTSLLESIFLLARQSDSRALLEVVRRRAHTESLPEAKVVAALLPANASIRGSFDGRDAILDWKIESEPDDEQTDRATFEHQVKMDARYGDREQSSTTILRTALAPQIRTRGDARVLCPAEFSSPFSLAEPASLVAANEASSRTGVKAEILTFLRDRFVGTLEGIELVDTLSRFHVRESGRTQAEDLGSYGEGMQRIFHIAMLFANVPGGIMLIDEFENAIHAGAFVPFAGLIRELAHRFNVQVFLSTHSAEVVDAWTSTETLRAEVVGYGLRRAATGRIEAVRFDGERLHALKEAFSFDLRGLV